ncbi:MAG: DUF2842 domain-containing protein [Methylobacteriaceae bacterium]|nr:DUF2842 domain-containing protein [Methylobacteriaceae bacterium]
MHRRHRKLLGATAMLVFVIFYALVAMTLAQAKPLQDAPGEVQAIVYAILGLAWVLPLMPLIAWMERGRRDR